MPHRVIIRSYAKLNYTLDVLSLRPDGYHGIASVMQTVSLSDELEIERMPDEGLTMSCSAQDIPTGPDNLAWRAADALLRDCGRQVGLRMHLTKQIPSQAGLGGGSSNAAAALCGIAYLLELHLGSERLCELAATVGSDVPFFIVGGTAVARGRGEQLAQLSAAPEYWFTVVQPESRVSTAEAYRALDAINERKSARATGNMEQLLIEGDPLRIAARMTNDFEQAVALNGNSIALLMDDMWMARAVNVRLCGSGSAVFGVHLTERDAVDSARLLRLKYLDVHVCKTVSASDCGSDARIRLEE